MITQWKKKSVFAIGLFLMLGFCLYSPGGKHRVEALAGGESQITKLRISVGEVYPLKKDLPESVRFSSNKKEIVTVSSKGELTGIKQGTAYVTVALKDGTKSKIKVIVENPKLSSTELCGLVGDVFTVELLDTERYSVFYCDDNHVLEVEENGKITLKASGTACVYTELGGIRYSCQVTAANDLFTDFFLEEDGTITEENRKIAIGASIAYEAVVKNGMSTYEMIKGFYDYIVLNTVNDYEAHRRQSIPASAYFAEGVFVEHVAAGQGFAHAMKLLLDKAGVENLLVTGSIADEEEGRMLHHIWNLVKLKGYWYHIDAAADNLWFAGKNKPEFVEYTYFMVSDYVMKSSHSWYSTAIPKAIGREFESLALEERIQTYKDQGRYLDSIVDLPDYLMDQIDAGENYIFAFYPESLEINYQAVFNRILRVYPKGASMTVYPITYRNQLSHIRIIVKISE